MSRSLAPRVATTDDAATATEILVKAFHNCPTWSWVFPDPAVRAEQHRAIWGALVEGGLRYPWVWLGAGGAATSVWIPPGEPELSPAQEAALEPMLIELMGPESARVFAALETFDANHPHDEPHYYLSLLGTDPAHYGNGYGLGLLEANLRLVDEAGLPAYLESSNPANVALYERYGFKVRSSFDLPGGGPNVPTMWREARPTASLGSTP
jgi:ribosomal protein S18 acetylase RimI-like enzyme